MQNRYVGDIGDFGKYGLLRVLCGTSPHLRLGVVWYLYDPKNEKVGDGRYISYLDCDKTKPTERNYGRFAVCDINLYLKLRKIVCSDMRHVSAICEEGVLPPNTIFYDKELSFDDLPPSAKQRRKERRQSWLDGAVKKTENCEIVFLDPDNGLETKSVQPFHKEGPKYVFLKEIRPYVERCQSVVIYQHLGRNLPAEQQICQRARQLRKQLRINDIMALPYGRGTARIFFVLPAQEHQGIIRSRAEQLVQGPWGKHFTAPRFTG